MRSQAPARQVRIRKLAKTTPQQVLREDQIEASEYSSLQNNVETGVEKSEEKEYHLQAALAASTGAGDKDAPNEIPAPPAHESHDIDYDALYTLSYEKPATYIRFSQTVEECTGCQYNMTTEDDAFLRSYNQKRPMGSKCSEDDFEKIMDVFEETGEIHAPYASIDGTVIPFETMKIAINQQISPKAQGFAQDIYEHWRLRKHDSGKYPLQPKLKFEKDQEKDDGDPYVCFRRRDVRQTRKTRGRDAQSIEKLKRLRKELEEARLLIKSTLLREEIKKDLLSCKRQVFEQRAKVKEAKVRLGIKTDDEDLIDERPQKRKIPDFTQPSRSLGPQMRLPGQPNGRPLDADLVLLSDVLDQKENQLQMEIEEKAQQHRKWNMGHVDLTREPLSPVHGQGPESGFRPATAQYQYLITPPSSVISESFDHPSPLQEKPEPFTFRYSPPPEEDEPQGQPAYRRRIGRGGRLWIDRKGMLLTAQGADNTVSDRWKYDQDDDDDEQPVYEMDPYDTKALRFRATIPLPPHLFPQRSRQDERAAQLARAAGSSPANIRAVSATPHQQQLQAPT